MKQSLITIAAIILILYLIYVALAYAVQNSMVFPGQYRATYPENNVVQFYPNIQQNFIKIDTTEIEYWYIDNNSDALLIYTHGNNTLLYDLPQRLDRLSKLGVDILSVEYPGFGNSTGYPSQKLIKKSQLKAFKSLKNKYKFHIGYGRSLGGGVILDIFDEIHFDGLILESTFANLKEFPPKFILPSFLLKTDYNNAEKLADYNNPVLIFHGTKDKTVPYENALKLDDIANNSELITYQTEHFEAPIDIEKHYQKIEEFLQKVVENDK
jgi:fermentation-respiration switch protein FrsA (DUF1100 family)